MALYALRIFLFTLFPLLLAIIIKQIDKTVNSKERFYEMTLILLFGISVAGSGIFNFIAHFFISDIVAESIGWEPGSPFQLEVAFANLALGILGTIAPVRRDGFREATVIAATVFSVGATIVHVMEIVSAGNLAPGNTIQNIGNILKPFLLIVYLTLSRKVENSRIDTEEISKLNQWRMPLIKSSGPLAVLISTSFGIGYAIDLVWLLSSIGIIASIGLVLIALSRSPRHDLKFLGKSD